MSIDVHVTSVLSGSNSLAMSDRLHIGLFTVAFLASAASLTALGAITAGTGYTTLPVLAPSGGTGSGGRARATSLKVVTATVATPGTNVAINDTFVPTAGVVSTLANGGVAGVDALLTASHIKAVSAAVNAGGTGGTPGAVTVTGTTGTGTKFQATGTINGGGILVGPLVVTVAGDYTVGPTSVTGEPVTGGGLTGATVNLGMGALTLAITTAGGYSTAPAATNTPANGTGTGSGVTVTLALGVGTAAITNSGNYSVAPSFTVTPTDGNGSGASIATGTLGGNGSAIVVGMLGSFPASYILQPIASVAAFQSTVYKSNLEWSIALTPIATGSTLAAGSCDVLLLG